MIGQTVSHFKILDKLGEGGMGSVYKAQDLKLDRQVALKFLSEEYTSDEGAKRRFMHEAKAASALDHPNICSIYDIEELPSGQTFLVMGYYQGQSLREVLEEGAMEVDYAISVAAQVAVGLAAAHEKGIVHRDVKPANILITKDGLIKILDFGVAKLAGATKLTKTGGTVGTIAYMSPEQITGKEVDARSDIFSLGVMFYEMLTGVRPFDADFDAAVMYRIVNEDPPPLADHRPNLPEHLQDLIGLALEKKKEDRLSSLDEFIAQLRDTGRPVAPRAGAPAKARRPRGAGPDDLIGPYRLRERIGVGGMGEVWAADQEEPFHRRVALKIIKLGMDTGEVVARFEAERQALALMDHPCIAKVYDAGSTVQGRPFFAMEFIHGVPINEYCDRHLLTTRDRLELFIHLCEGVQHAHQKAVIHRDLKPSNVLVAEVDNKPVPKIIDFGVAKATSQRLTDKTMYTHMGQLIGTPEYMSPEQAELTGENIDTRTDVYSLGAILYELLVGRLPFDPEELKSGGFDGIRKKIREEIPSKPSRRVTTLGESTASTAKSRRTDPASLSGQLKGDLDWIVMKALEKDRSRRYASASELAADIQRHLKHEPVLAGPPSGVYRFKKFVLRHRYAVAAAGLVGVALVLGITGTTLGLFRATQAQRMAREEAAAASQVSGFLEQLFSVSDPGEAKGNTVTAREILDQGAERIARELEGQPLVQARLMVTMGRVYRQLGLYDESRSLLNEALEIRRRELGEKSLDVAASEEELGQLLVAVGDYKAALPLYEAALKIREDLLGSEDPEVARMVNNLANLHRETRSFDEATRLYERALAIREKSLGPDHPDVSNSLNGLAIVLEANGEYKKALPLYERALAIREKTFGTDHPQVATSLNNLATLYWLMGDNASARPLNERALAIQEKVLGRDHPDLAYTLNMAAILRAAASDYTAARRLYERALAIRQKSLRPDHPSIADSYYNLACVSALQGDRKAALRFLRESIERGFAKPVILDDSDLASIRGEAEFDTLVAEVRERLENVK
jgi:serine/threonine protein kinase/tetratricopeptide (TPR) repeat protein